MHSRFSPSRVCWARPELNRTLREPSLTCEQKLFHLPQPAAELLAGRLACAARGLSAKSHARDLCTSSWGPVCSGAAGALREYPSAKGWTSLPQSRKLTVLVNVLRRPCTSFPLPALWTCSPCSLHPSTAEFGAEPLSPLPFTPKVPAGHRPG